MFRSLFARLLITMTLVLTVSLLILSAVLANYTNDYEKQKRVDALDRTAEAAAALLDSRLGLSTVTSLGDVLSGDEPGLSAFFRVYLSNTEEMLLVLADSEGRILLSEDGTDAPPTLRGSLLDSTLTRGVAVDGRFVGSAPHGEGEDPHAVVAYRLTGANGAHIGTVAVFSLMPSFGGMTGVVLRTVLLSSLWIVLGAVVILYLFSERVSGPLREMNAVTERFAKGRFDRRVTVVGNDEVASLGAAFNQMADSLEQLETMRNSFISNVSHDLRTPMTTVLGFIEGITSGAIPEEKHDYYLAVIADEIRRLSRLVTELLDLSRLQSGTRKFNFTTFDICEMARLILISSEQRIEARCLEVGFETAEESILVRGDKDAIHQVLYNLCDNAIKFAREGGALNIAVTPTGKRRVAISVYNEGDGIPTADIPFIFDRFYKSDKSRSQDKTGAGLGLYISKTILEAHGEGLTLESEEGKSCTFTFTLSVAGD